LRAALNCISESVEQRVNLAADRHRDQGEDEKQRTQYNRDPEQGFLDTTPSGKDTTRILAGQATQANAFVLHNYTGHERY
jgi:hypothetical protein